THRPLAWLRNAQSFEHEHRVGGREGDELLRRGLRERARAVGTLAAKPFEHTADTARVVALCLTGRMFLLEALPSLEIALVGDLDSLAADKERLAVGVYSHQRIGLIQVNADRMNACRFWSVQGERHPAQQAPIALDDRQAVNLLSAGKRVVKCHWHGATKALAPSNRQNREQTIRAEVRIPAALADQEQRASAVEGEGPLNVVTIGLRAGVGACCQANRRARHLAIERSRNPRIH